MECIRLLVSLKDPRPGLRDAFLSWQRGRLKEALTSLQRGGGGVHSPRASDPESFIAWVSTGVDQCVSFGHHRRFRGTLLLW